MLAPAPRTRALLAAAPTMDSHPRMTEPPISGDPPNPIDPPSGRRFRTRCNRYFLMSFTVLSIFLPAFSEGPLPISLS